MTEGRFNPLTAMKEEKENEEEVVEIDPDGRIWKDGKAPVQKPIILRDPEGEY